MLHARSNQPTAQAAAQVSRKLSQPKLSVSSSALPQQQTSCACGGECPQCQQHFNSQYSLAELPEHKQLQRFLKQVQGRLMRRVQRREKILITRERGQKAQKILTLHATSENSEFTYLSQDTKELLAAIARLGEKLSARELQLHQITISHIKPLEDTSADTLSLADEDNPLGPREETVLCADCPEGSAEDSTAVPCGSLGKIYSRIISQECQRIDTILEIALQRTKDLLSPQADKKAKTKIAHDAFSFFLGSANPETINLMISKLKAIQQKLGADIKFNCRNNCHPKCGSVTASVLGDTIELCPSFFCDPDPQIPVKALIHELAHMVELPSSPDVYAFHEEFSILPVLPGKFQFENPDSIALFTLAISGVDTPENLLGKNTNLSIYPLSIVFKGFTPDAEYRLRPVILLARIWVESGLKSLEELNTGSDPDVVKMASILIRSGIIDRRTDELLSPDLARRLLKNEKVQNHVHEIKQDLLLIAKQLHRFSLADRRLEKPTEIGINQPEKGDSRKRPLFIDGPKLPPEMVEQAVAAPGSFSEEQIVSLVEQNIVIFLLYLQQQRLNKAAEKEAIDQAIAEGRPPIFRSIPEPNLKRDKAREKRLTNYLRENFFFNAPEKIFLRRPSS